MPVERDATNPDSEVVRPANDAEVSLDEMLSLACRQGKQEIAELLMESGALVSRRNKSGNTPLLEACSQGYVQMAALLLDRGADIDAATETTQDSALTWACTLGNESIVRLLLERNANVEHRTKDGCTALMFSALAGHVKVSEMLLDKNAMLNVHSDSNMDSPLTFACWKGHIDVVELLLNRGADLEHRTKEGFTPLMFAALGGHTAVADCLLKRNASVNVPSGSNNDIPLTSACWKGHRDVVELLLKHKSDLEHRTKDGCTPLMLAAREGHLTVAQLILKHGGRVNTPSGSENNIPLTLACWKGHVDVVRLLLDAGSHIEHRNKAGCTPLMLAAREGHLETTRLLLDRGAKLDEASGSNEDTPLTLACWKGHPSVVDLLLHRKSNADHQTKTGCTPLMEATREGHVPVAEILLNHGADVETPDNYGQSPLFMACWKGHTEVADLLLKHNANKDCRTKTGITPLFQACRENHVGVVRLLLDHGCSVNAGFPNSRENPLTLAAEKGFIDLVSLLLNRGASVDARTKKGCSPFLLGCKEGHKEIVQLLAERGADLEASDQRNTTPLLAAFKNGHVEIVEWLLKRINHYPSDDECQKAQNAPCPPGTNHEKLQALRSKCVKLIEKARTQKMETAEMNAQKLCQEEDAEKEKKAKQQAKKREKRRKQQEKKKKEGELQMMREEEKQRERLRQEQNLREVADRVATAQQATEQAEEEDDEAVIEDGNGRNVVAILDEDQDEESPSPSVMSDAGGQKEHSTVEVGASQPMATGPPMTIPKKGNKGKKPRSRSRDKQGGTRSVDEPKLKPSRKQPSESSSPSTLFQKKYSHSPPFSQSNPATHQQSAVAAQAKSSCKDFDAEPVSCAPSRADDSRDGSSPSRPGSVSVHRHLERSQPHQKSTSPTECCAGKPSMPSYGVDNNNAPDEERRDDNSSLTSDELLSRYQTDDEKVACQEGKAADASCSKTLDFELVVVTSTRTTTATTVSTSVSNSSHAPLALTSSGDGAEPWHDVHRSTRVVHTFVPNTLVGRIFGIHGSKINSICEISGAQITISKDTNPSGERMVTIKGTSKAIEKAQQMIDDALSRTDKDFNKSSVRKLTPHIHFDEIQEGSVPLRRASHTNSRKIAPPLLDKKSASVPAFRFTEDESKGRHTSEVPVPVEPRIIRDLTNSVIVRDRGQINHACSEPQFTTMSLNPPLTPHLPLSGVASAPPCAVNTHGQPSNANGDTLTSERPQQRKTFRTLSAPVSTVAGVRQLNLGSPYGNKHLSPSSSLTSTASCSSSGLLPGEDDMHRPGSPFAMPLGPDGPVGGYGAIGSQKKNVTQTASSGSSNGSGDSDDITTTTAQAIPATYSGEPLSLFPNTVWSAHSVPSSVPSGPSLAPIGTSVDEHLTDTGKPQYAQHAEKFFGPNWAQSGNNVSQWSGRTADKRLPLSHEPVGSGYRYGGSHTKLSHAESWPRYQSSPDRSVVPQRKDSTHDERDRHYGLSSGPNVWAAHQEVDSHNALGRSCAYETAAALDHSNETRWPISANEPRGSQKRRSWHPSLQDHDIEQPMAYLPSALPRRQETYQPSYTGRPISSYGAPGVNAPPPRLSPGLASVQQQELLVSEMLTSSSISSFKDLAHLLTNWGLEDHHIQLLMERNVTLPVLLEMPENEINRLGLALGPKLKLLDGLHRLKGPSLPLDLRGDYSSQRVHSSVAPSRPPQSQQRLTDHRRSPGTSQFGCRVGLPRLQNVAPAQLPYQMGGHAYYPVCCSGSTIYVYDPYYSHQR